MYIHVRSLFLSLFFTVVLFCALPFANPVFAQEQVPHPVSAEHQTALPAMTSVPPSSIFKLDNAALGQAVAVSGNWLASSTPQHSFYSDVLLYRRAAADAPWEYHSKIVATNDPAEVLPYMGFGAHIALDGDTLAISASAAQLTTYRQGIVYVYRLVGDTWQREATLLPVDAPFGGEIGDSIAIDGDTIVAGAYDGAYAAYVFQRTGSSPATWSQVATLAPQTPAAYPHSKAVAIYGDTVAVSTPRFAGVYLFARDQGGANQWGQIAALAGTEGSAFGKAISLYGDILAVGEPSETSNGTVHVFQHDAAATPAWEEVATLAPAAESWGFGSQVVAGDGIVLTNGQATDGNPTPLPAFVRNFGGPDAWGQALQLLPGDISAPTLTLFGASLALDGPTAVIGAPGADSFETYEGVAPQLFFTVLPSSPAPRPGERLVWNLQLYNSTNSTIANADIAATLPALLPLAAPVDLAPAQPAAQLAQKDADLPGLAGGLVISPGVEITLAAPVHLPSDVPTDLVLTAGFTLTGEIPSGTVAQAVTASVTTRQHATYIPLLARPYPVYLPPGYYPVSRCASQRFIVDGVDVGKLTECVNGVMVRADGYMQFNFIWLADLVAGRDSVVKYSDASNTNMYLTDNYGSRYDHVATGGAANGGTLYDNRGLTGWFLFPPAQKSATIFAFHDDDQGLLLGKLVLPQ
jgi:hypothetical protein